MIKDALLDMYTPLTATMNIALILYWTNFSDFGH